MYTALQDFTKNDNGFEQYVGRYEDVSSDLAVRIQFAAWSAEMDKLEIWKAVGKAEGKAEGEAIGEARGEARGEIIGMQKKSIMAAKRMLLNGISPEIVADCQELPLSEVNDLLTQIENEKLMAEINS